MEKGLFELLENYKTEDIYPFHMPGHKRNPKFLKVTNTDITEITGFDDLHHPEGVIKALNERANELYKRIATGHVQDMESFIMVNGSTGGILSAIGACRDKGKRILAARNCHKSLYNAVYINELDADFIFPDIEEQGTFMGLTKEKVQTHLEKAAKEGIQYSALMIVSPTYEGRVSDVRGIADVCHHYGIPLIVDEAHGAHFGFCEELPESSCGYGDIVIHSLHKTLPSLTQTALIHVSGDLVDREKLKKNLSMYQSSSPSYILMGSVDSCITLMEDEERKEDLGTVLARIKVLKDSAQRLSNISFLKNDDPTRLVFCHKKMTGKELFEILRSEFRLEGEMCAGNYVVFISTLCDTEEGFSRLEEAFKQIDVRNGSVDVFREGSFIEEAAKAMTVSEALDEKHRREMPEKCEGLVAGDFIYIYPPGIPLIVPGEVIENKHIENIKELSEKGYEVVGLNKDGIMVVDR